MFVLFLKKGFGNSSGISSLLFQTLHYDLYDMFIKTTTFYQNKKFTFAMAPTLVLTANVES